MKHPDTHTDTDAARLVRPSAADTIAALRDLTAIASYEDARLSDDRLEELGIVLEGGDPSEDQADRLLDEMALAVESTTTFELVLGTGGPDRRLCLECVRTDAGRYDDGDRIPASYEVRRAYYSFSWAGHAECELNDADREIAEAFGRRIVPGLDG